MCWFRFMHVWSSIVTCCHNLYFVAVFARGGVFGIQWVKVFFFFRYFFFLSGKQILHEWRHVTKHDDVWLGYKRKESTRGARRELAFGSAFSRFWSVGAKFARNRRCLAVAAAVRRGRRWNGQLSQVSFFPSQVGSSSTKQASAFMLCWVCMLLLPVAPPLTGLAAATLR